MKITPCELILTEQAIEVFNILHRNIEYSPPDVSFDHMDACFAGLRAKYDGLSVDSNPYEPTSTARFIFRVAYFSLDKGRNGWYS